MDINKYVGNKIREFREKRNITQEEIAEVLNTKPQTISRYELGLRKTNQDVLFKLADYFNISINDFFPPIKSNKEKEAQNETYKQILKEKGLMDDNDYKNIKKKLLKEENN